MNLPATVANLDIATAIEVLSRHAANVTEAARDLGVPASDLRRLLWATPSLQDAVFEAVQTRLDLAEKNIAESLRSGDNRERLAASMFTIKNSHRARKRGWITSSTSAAELSISTAADQPRTYVFRWGRPDEAEPATAFERDGKTFEVPKYGGYGPDGDRASDDPIEGELATPPALIEHEAPSPEPPAAAPTPERQLPKWLGPGGPPPLVAHLYQPWAPPQPAFQLRPEPEPISRWRGDGCLGAATGDLGEDLRFQFGVGTV
jgi:hypothetical protein